MKVFYSDRFDLHPPAGHRFPGTKYGLLRRRLIEAAMLQPSPPASGDAAHRLPVVAPYLGARAVFGKARVRIELTSPAHPRMRG